jgi:hypothetical protein
METMNTMECLIPFHVLAAKLVIGATKYEPQRSLLVILAVLENILPLLLQPRINVTIVTKAGTWMPLVQTLLISARLVLLGFHKIKKVNLTGEFLFCSLWVWFFETYFFLFLFLSLLFLLFFLIFIFCAPPPSTTFFSSVCHVSQESLGATRVNYTVTIAWRTPSRTSKRHIPVQFVHLVDCQIMDPVSAGRASLGK